MEERATPSLARLAGAAAATALGIALLESVAALASPDSVVRLAPPSFLALAPALLTLAQAPAVALAVLVALPFRRRGAAPALAAGTVALLAVEETLRRLPRLRGDVDLLFAAAAGLLGLAASRSFARSRPPTAAGAAFVLLAIAGLTTTLSSARFGLEAAVGAPKPQDRSSPPPSTATPRPRNVLFLLVDTLRADHLGCYGYPRATSPTVDRLAAEGTLFEDAVTPQPKTSPAVASLFTGLYPDQHRVRRTSTVLPQEHTTLAEILHDRGFRTFAVAANVNISQLYGFDQGFERFFSVRRRSAAAKRLPKGADRVRRKVESWLEEIAAAADPRPFFLYAHFIDPHSPYRPPPPYDRRFRGDALDGRLGRPDLPLLDDDYVDGLHRRVFLPDLDRDLDGYVARYDGEIAFADREIGRILAALDRLGLADDTLVVFTADHGESMTEHDTYFNHGLFPYEEQIHIPLVIRGPGVARGVRRSETVSLVGLAATLLDCLGLPVPETFAEPSFAALLKPGAPPMPRPPVPLSARGGEHRIDGLRTARFAWWRHPRGLSPFDLLSPATLFVPGRRFRLTLARAHPFDARLELYDLSDDRREHRNLAFRDPRRAFVLEAQRRRLLASLPPRGPEPRVLERAELATDVADELRQMGYLGGG